MKHVSARHTGLEATPSPSGFVPAVQSAQPEHPDHTHETYNPDMETPLAFEMHNANVFYGNEQALFDVSMKIRSRGITALIGPSGCGKSTLLRCLNRMNDVIPGCRVSGRLMMGAQDIYHPSMETSLLRARVGMVFQKPNPFPKSIYNNVAYGPRIHGLAKNKAELDAIVYRSLEKAALLSEVRDRIHTLATGLSGGQQQRLCIARALAVDPEAILMDEPCSALDPIATARIESLMYELRKELTIVVVTHSMQQAARVSRRVAFFHMGRLVEEGETKTIFTAPKEKRTQDYITGRYG